MSSMLVSMCLRKFRALAVVFLAGGLMVDATSAALVNSPPASVTTFRVYELALSANDPTSLPYKNGPTVTATFTGTSGDATGKVLVMKGFWDGSNIWRIRFAPTAVGDWSWVTSSTDAGLNGASGSVTAVAPTAQQLQSNVLYHGFLEPDGYAFKLSDGTPFLAVGDTQWSFSEEFTTSEWQTWMSARQSQHYNTFLGCIWLAIYSRTGVPEAFANKDPKTDSPNLAFFQRLDGMVQYANDRGIMMGLTIGGFPDNSNWWNKMGTRARDDRWFRYCIARYTAYNVRWGLYGEVNERNTPWGATWQQEVAYKAQLVKDEDPYDHPLGSHHNAVDTSSANNANIDYIEVQIDQPGDRTETQWYSALNYRTYGKPVWFEEYWYENSSGDGEYTLGIRNTHRNFVAAMAFPTMGSLMRNHFTNYPQPDASQAINDPGAIRMSYFYSFYKNLDIQHFTPSTNLVSSGTQCGKFGSDYACFKQGGGSFTIDLSGVGGSFDVTRLNINNGVTASLGATSGGGVRTINTGISQDVAVLIELRGSATNTAPSVDAGGDQTIEMGQAAVLNGFVTDDGLPNPPSALTLTWNKVDGPGTVYFGDPASEDTTATFSAIGVYTLRLTADDSELQGSDDLIVDVRSNIPGDGDNDGDVDMEDFSVFQICLSGSGEYQTDPACLFADIEGDGDVDQTDADHFFNCLTGADIFGNPLCAG